MFCRRCWINFASNENYIQCSGPCGQMFHGKCVDIPADVVNEIRRIGEELEWYCKECRRLYRLQMYFEIAICDDYSLPIDFVKKRPSSFDPCLAEAIPNPETWIAPSPLSDFVAFVDQHQQQQQQGPPPQSSAYPAAATSASATLSGTVGGGGGSVGPATIVSTLPVQHSNHFQLQLQQLQHKQQQQQQQQQQQPPHYSTHHKKPKQRPHSQHPHPPLPNTIKQASIKLIEGYSDPKDSKRPKKVYHKKSKRRSHRGGGASGSSRNYNNNNSQQSNKDKRSNYSSDSSAPKSSDDDDDVDDEDNQSVKVPELNSPDSISEDLVRPLPPQLHRSPRKLTTGGENSKRNPSPYYYSDLLKSKDAPTTATTTTTTAATAAAEKEAKNKIRQSTASEPPQLTQPPITAGAYRKSTSLDVPEREERPHNSKDSNENDKQDDEEEDEVFNEAPDADRFEVSHAVQPTSSQPQDTPKRYSFTEDGVRIIRCTTPSTSTSDDSDCSECQKRREWHSRALALVRKTCNVQAGGGGISTYVEGAACATVNVKELQFIPLQSDISSMPPHRLLGPTVCACVAPTVGDDLDEYFRPRSIFYVHPQGVHECADCSPDLKRNLNLSSFRDPTPAADADSSSANLTASAVVVVDNENDDEDEMSGGRTRQFYETAFDCKIAKSDDDLDEVDRIQNHSVLLELNNGNNVTVPPKSDHHRSSSAAKLSNRDGGKSRLEGKRLKNSKNQAIQEKTTTTIVGGAELQHSTATNASGSLVAINVAAAGTMGGSGDAIAGSVSALSTELENVHIHSSSVDQMNNTTSTSQLPMRGYTPSPPSTAPLPMKFPGKHDRFFMNSIKSAPNLPSTNPAHPRLKDLRLPTQSSLRQHHQQQQHSQQHQQLIHQGSSSLLLDGSNDNSLADSGLYPAVNPPSSHHHHHHHIPTHPHHSQASSRARDRPRSFVLESGRVLELRKSHNHHHHHVANGSGSGRRQHNYSSTESIATSSSGGSMESLRSSTSEGNRSTSSSESRHSTSLSSHSSESGSLSVAFPLRAPIVIHSKLHILSPISDKSSQEPVSDASEFNKTQNTSPEDVTMAQHQHQQQQQLQQQHQHKTTAEISTPPLTIDVLKKQRRTAPNKTLLHLADEILGSDSGISLHSREDGKSSGLHKFTLPKLNFPPSDKVNHDSDISAVGGGISSSVGLPQDLRDLPFDMPKLRRRKTIQQDACTSGSATSVDLGDLPFDMPKLRRRLRMNQAEINSLMVHSTESSGISQASSSHSMRDENKVSMKLDTAIFRQNLTLNLNEPHPPSKFGSLDLRGISSNKELNLNLITGFTSAVDLIDVKIPLERQGWYHGAITRIEAETTLRPLNEGTFLVRNCESTKQDYSLSLKGAKGFMHMRIQRNDAGQYILGQFSRPFDSVPEMIRHFCLNRLPVRGAEHMCLLEPVIAQLL